MKFQCWMFILILCFALSGCATEPGQYPVWEPETIAVGIGGTDQTLFRNDPHTVGHYGNIGGQITVTATFRVHPTVTVHPPNTPTLVKPFSTPKPATD